MNTRWTSVSLSGAKGLPGSFEGRGGKAKGFTFSHPSPLTWRMMGAPEGGVTAQVKRRLCLCGPGWTRLVTLPHDFRDKGTRTRGSQEAGDKALLYGSRAGAKALPLEPRNSAAAGSN